MKRVVMVAINGELTYLTGVKGPNLFLSEDWEQAIDYDIDKLSIEHPSLSFYVKFIDEEKDNSSDKTAIVAIVSAAIVAIVSAAIITLALLPL